MNLSVCLLGLLKSGESRENAVGQGDRCGLSVVKCKNMEAYQLPLRVPLSSEIMMLSSFGYGKGTSHMRVL